MIAGQGSEKYFMPQRKVMVPEMWKTELEAAFKSHSILYVWAFAGWGKTSVLRAALEDAQWKYDYISAGQRDCKEALQSLSKRAVIVDDLELLEETARPTLLAQLEDEKSNRRFILLSRVPMPAYLKPYFSFGQLKEYDCESLRWSGQEAMSLFRELGIGGHMQWIYTVLEDSQGYPLKIYFYGLRLEQGRLEGEPLRQAVAEDVYGYFDAKLRAEWDHDLLNLMMCIADFPAFEAELARMLTGRNDIRVLLENACRYGLNFEPPDCYRVNPILLEYLRARQKREWCSERIRRNRCSAGLYFELQNDIRSAMRCYEQAGDRGKVSELLILDAKRNPGEGSFYELEPFYDLLDEEKVLASPELMSGLAMLRALCFRAEESTRWYKELKAYHQNPRRTPQQKANAAVQLRYLDIALPQFGSGNIARQLLAVAKNITSGKEVPRTMTMTSSLPSLLSGSKDFCHWTPRDRILGRIWKHPVELVAGINGAGLADTAVGESLLEKSWDKNDSEPLMLLNAGFSAARNSKGMEISFVAAAQTARFLMVQGKPDMAVEHLRRFKELFGERLTTRMHANLHAVQVRIALQRGDLASVSNWLRTEAPDERFALHTMDRYCLLTKVRCYLLMGENLEAMTLLDTLLRYADQYGRTYINMESQMLTAMVQFREGCEDWRVSMTKALKQTEKYRFIRLISDEGVAVRPLLEKLKPDIEIPYYAHLMAAVKRHSIYYARYLIRPVQLLDALSESECLALRLIAQGRNNKEMSVLMCVSPNTIKYYVKNIYEKLNISTRAEAIRISEEVFHFGNQSPIGKD